jgi:uncharacterized protein YecA (UPF0149 family)
MSNTIFPGLEGSTYYLRPHEYLIFPPQDPPFDVEAYDKNITDAEPEPENEIPDVNEEKKYKLARVRLERFLASGNYSILRKSLADRNDKCPCGSGLKFKKCCIDLK